MTKITQTQQGVYRQTMTPFEIPQGIHVYILDKKDQRIGVLAATSNDLNPDTVYIGWSLCNFSLGDRFDPKRGVQIAYERSRKCSIAPFPMSLNDRYDAFKFRCEKYFKDKRIFI
jgi:hypothetical protein